MTPVSDTEQGQEDEPQPLQPYATDRGHFDENVSDAAVNRYIITTVVLSPLILIISETLVVLHFWLDAKLHSCTSTLRNDNKV